MATRALSAHELGELVGINAPGFHEPVQAMIDAAARNIPRLLAEKRCSPLLAEGQQGTEEWVAAHHLAVEMEDAGHSEAATAWALYRLTERGFLEGEVRCCRVDAEQKLLMAHQMCGSPPRLVNSHLGIFPGGLGLPPCFLPPAEPGDKNTAPPVYYLAIRPTAALWSWRQDSPGGAVQMPANQPPAVTVILGARYTDPILVRGRRKSLTRAQYDVIKAVAAAWPDLLTKDQLPDQSKHSDAVNILKRIAEIDADWESVIHLAGKTGGGYGLK
jgi:hypothetical protein